ncbi:UDP-glycosyltransferase 74F1 [Abeliophyllum distichum]|uniref:anthocyanidin 3-O-glucoside 5-O-glucosyltransferase n=1 Tax=Abeliophyllum distichum TaxID=126358 RepID=A0ABD1R9F6_9LAMI
MDKEKNGRILAVPFPSPGHINPMTQLCKRLVSKGFKATIVLTKFIAKNIKGKSDLVQIETISDGDDEFHIFARQSVPDSVVRFTKHGSESLAQLIYKYESLGDTIVCVIYDSLLSWVVQVPKKLGLISVVFFTQQSAVNFFGYYFYHKLLANPVVQFPVSIPGLPLLYLQDIPTYGIYQDHHTFVANQFSTVDKADFAFVNTFYELEEEVLEAMSKVCQMMTVGPTIPSFYLENRIENDKEYGLSLPQDASTCLNWLNSKSAGSVVYASLSSVGYASPNVEQMEELAYGLKGSNYNFLWVVKSFEMEKLPENFIEETSDKGLIVQWCPQLEVLSNKAVGCILSHCGWNSTIEAISLGVPIVAMPMWADQLTNAKFIQDVWKVGVRVKRDENGIAGREEIEACIREVTDGERAIEIKESCAKWKTLAKEAVSEGGISDRNISELGCV